MGQFYDRSEAMFEQGRLLCVGLDPTMGRFPDPIMDFDVPDTEKTFLFMANIVDAVADVAGFMKPNKAKYDALGEGGMAVFNRVVAYITAVNPDIVIIGDGKRADIGATNQDYAVAEFDKTGVDAMTTNPYFGEIPRPFLDKADKGVIPVVKTSNPDSNVVQNIPVRASDLRKLFDADCNPQYTDEQILEVIDVFDGKTVFPLFAAIATRVRHQWNYNDNVGMVAGATYPEELELMRRLAGSRIPLLVPGVGAQGGSARDAARLATNEKGGGAIINEARSIIYASDGANFAEAARAQALSSAEQILAGLDDKRKAGF